MESKRDSYENRFDSDSLYGGMTVRDAIAREIFVEWMEDASQFTEPETIRRRAEMSVTAANLFLDAIDAASA